MPESPTILFAGGGTGGHLYPGISVAQALLKLNPNIKPLFLTTTKEIDKVILGPTGFPAARGRLTLGGVRRGAPEARRPQPAGRPAWRRARSHPRR